MTIWLTQPRDRAREEPEESAPSLAARVVQREKLATLGHLISGVAHELNNPLTTVCGYAQLLQRHAMPQAARQELTRLAREAERAARIVKNLLVFARPSKPERQRLSIQEILEQALNFRAYQLAVQNIAVERRYAANLPALWADPHALQQVFLNLLLNAEQAILSLRDRGTILLRTLHLHNPERVRVEISDDGPGIPPDKLPHLFQPFFTTKQDHEGTGLGLSISCAIVQEHDGELSAANRPGGGATFAVELPAAWVAEPVATAEPKPRSISPAPLLTPHILVVDDERSVAHLIADVLREEGYGVELHTDSPRALFRALAVEFDLAICDIRMPEVDGKTFYTALLERGHPLASRILFTTGDTLARKTGEFLERVGLPCLAKPFLVEELKTAVRDLLSKGSTRSARGHVFMRR